MFKLLKFYPLEMEEYQCFVSKVVLQKCDLNGPYSDL
jgi:hypothetical protein